MFLKKIKNIIITFFGENTYFALRWFFKHKFRYFSLFSYWNIQGWLSENEAIALYDKVRSLTTDKPIIVELGSWLGKSSVVLAKGLCHKKSGILYCIDTFEVDGDEVSRSKYLEIKQSLSYPLKEVFINNIRKSKVNRYIKILQGRSSDVVKGWQKQIDFLFIDANHNYSTVKEDFFLWSNFIKLGGYIVFHDVRIDPERLKIYNGGALRVIEEYILPNNNWVNKEFIDSLFIAKKC